MLQEDENNKNLDIGEQQTLDGGVLRPSYDDMKEVVGIIVDDIYEIKISELGGLGSFALKRIEERDIVLLERPLMKSSDYALGQNLAELSDVERRVFYSLHPYSESPKHPLRKKIWSANA